MTTKYNSDPIVLVTGSRSRESRLRESLERAIERPIRSICPTELEDALEQESNSALQLTGASGVEPTTDGGGTGTSSSAGLDGETTGGGTSTATDAGTGLHRPAAIVLESNEPEEVQALLESIRDELATVPTVVTPPQGSETLAAVALRGDADEYVPADSDDVADRIRETITETASADETGATRPDHAGHTDHADRSYQRILADELPDEAFVLGENGTFLEANVCPESTNVPALASDDLIGSRLEDAFPDTVADRLQRCLDEALRSQEVQSVEYEMEVAEGTRRFEARIVPTDERVDGRRAVVWLVRDITERARRERKLRSRQSELETLNRINAIIRQVIETLVEAPSRDTIEQEVCDQLVDSDLYCGAWIAGRTGDDNLAHRIEAGDADTYLERARSVDHSEECPVTKAVRTNEPQVTNRILEQEPLSPDLQAAAAEDDVKATISVPISYEDATYGVLTVLASRKHAFTDSEKAEFELLGETIGFTIMAVKNRQLLRADTVVELEFRIDGGDTFSFDLSETYDCTCSLEWAGTTAKGRTFQYVTIDGLEGDIVLEEARAHDSIEECRLIHDGVDQCTIEMRLCKSGVRTLTNHGATIQDITVEDGVGSCLVEVPQDADIREIADALSVIYENTELVARREVDRPVRTAAERRNRILDELTDRQLTTLRLAYYGGFFEWPRESTGEEIAEAMDVSPPTMHQHLRKGLKSILSEFFENSGGRPE